MNSRPAIGLDVDGVILDYVTGFLDHARKLGHTPSCEADKVASWNMQSVFPSLDEAAIWNIVESFSVDDGFGRLNTFEDAVETIKALKEEYADHPIVAITSAGSSPITRSLRLTNLAGIPLDELHVIGLGESKEDHFARLPAGSLYVDDLMKNVESAERVGVSGILVRRSYNVTDHHLRVAVDWNEIAEHVRGILGPIPDRTFGLPVLSASR